MNEYININEYRAFSDFSSYLTTLFNKHLSKNYSDIIFLCIGTDRSTGDSLGPIIGYKLSTIENEFIHIYGTLENPVHAKNLDENIQKIYLKYSHPFVVAIDACLGALDHIGFINIKEGSLKPGSGVKKELSSVGDISIAGIVNLSGYLDFMVLQNTRLSLVMKMADLISLGIKYSVYKLDSKMFKRSPKNLKTVQFLK